MQLVRLHSNLQEIIASSSGSSGREFNGFVVLEELQNKIIKTLNSIVNVTHEHTRSTSVELVPKKIGIKNTTRIVLQNPACCEL